MIGLVLVTHGRLADELRSAMEHVVGVQRNVATVCIGPNDDIEGRRAEVLRRITEVDTGDGVVLLTDMFGGTPSNLAISQMDRKGVEVISGVNLPMLVKLAKVRSSQPLAEVVDCAATAGRKYIAAASHVLRRDSVLREYMLEFIHHFAPHLERSDVIRTVANDGADVQWSRIPRWHARDGMIART